MWGGAHIAVTLALLGASPDVEPSAQPKQPAPSVEEAHTVREATSVLILDLVADGVEGTRARVFTDIIASRLARVRTLHVLTSADLRQATGLEAQKQAFGCEADEGCLAEIADALGARYVVSGSVGRLGAVTVVSLGLYDSQAARSAARETLRSDDEARLPAELEAATDRLISGIVDVPVSEASEPPAPFFTSPLFLGGAATAGVGAVTAAALFAFAGSQELVLRDPAASSDAKDSAYPAGIGAFIGGALATGVTVVGVSLLAWALVP